MKITFPAFLLSLSLLFSSHAYSQSCSAEATGASASGKSEIAAPSTSQNVAAALKNEKDLMMFSSLIDQSNLTEQLSGEGQFTVFAPNDGAFNACSADDQQNMSDHTMRANVIKYHVVSGRKLSLSDLQHLDGEKLKTLNGMDLAVTVRGGELLIDGAKVVGQEIVTPNGIVHVIDTVNMPKMAAMRGMK